MIAIIVAMTKKGVIGARDTLPWHIPAELKNFKKITTGNTVIMGRKTFESIGRTLPCRNNIIISSSPLITVQGAVVCSSIAEAVAKARAYNKDIFVIGGAHVYAQFLPLANRLLISYIKQDYEGDILFPEFDPTQWKLLSTESYPEFDFCVYGRLQQELNGQ
jgi:dihydrofolate reductase